MASHGCINSEPEQSDRFFLHPRAAIGHAAPVVNLSEEEIDRAVSMALAEDVGSGDVTSLSVVPAETMATANVVAREDLVACGIPVAIATFKHVSSLVECSARVSDGDEARADQVLLHVHGPARAILTAERVALNFVQRLSGVATLTRKFVTAIADTKSKILDTRKTTPGLRMLEKYAVACGGGVNYRVGLHDQILIKDNHLAALHDVTANPIAAAVSNARARYPSLKVEVEADTVEQAKQAADCGADIVLLDNMTTTQLSAAVEAIAGRCKTEASGGINLTTVLAVADTGVDFISVGAITHSARAMDVALDFIVSSST